MTGGGKVDTREKVMLAMECCAPMDGGERRCETCPYFGDSECIVAMMEDTKRILREGKEAGECGISKRRS